MLKHVLAFDHQHPNIPAMRQKVNTKSSSTHCKLAERAKKPPVKEIKSSRNL